jgi:nucleotide-binding universal stress UspA family protein
LTPRVADNQSDVAKRVLVLVDGIHSVELIGAVARLIALHDAEVLLLYVDPAGPRAGLEMARHRPARHGLPPHRLREVEEAERQSGAEALAEAAGALGDLAAGVETSAVRGDAGRVVCESAARWHADVVAIRAGGRDRPPVGPASVGPVSRYVTDHAPCAVLLLR